ncbi:2-C-methyl-D-erythritol 4-phosphate cytidylyltransferase [Paramaledivibacter caminithermalis]|uniref:2-C-methyl-D-erythritol 4-phosphate cytidylyltransferase n=1 Tax=Paramaledivibacter caminithermalis (strain DSM 15212 / CIP 107654 / DViRD3) TaxID=1121301 RepID=A0A1M6N2I7_PARC5|nr:2-C-methyl-D-erythritol 4-phosphate cytidylyltransferase [Paramaledivibacter caminithermalis]SHJ89949.1 2-C-methyl-D-erythritol 4-phosphate cytidylyltransferase [Paramaledivibacter caminithermalis DSM 15212]
MNTAIILAAGKGTRMKAQLNKQYLLLKGKPIIIHTLEVFERSPLIDEIILVINKNDVELCKKNVLKKYRLRKVTKIINGGKERQASVLNGLSQINPKSQIVLIHDGARPLVTEEIIKSCIEGAKEYGAVSAGVPIKDTVKIIKEDGFVNFTPKRKDVWITQTPQAFKTEIIKNAHRFAATEDILGTDDAMLVEQMGVKVKMVVGDYENLKITTPEDLITAEAILNYKRRW